MPRRKKKSPLKLIMRKETILSLAAIALILLGVLVMVSFSGKGVLLSEVNLYFTQNFGFSMLLLPFICIAAGLVLFQTNLPWTKPHILLGALLIFLGVLLHG